MKDKSILVIEDDALNMKLVKCLLQLKNYTVLEAKNAESGIKIACSRKPDLILMDIQLPGMDGIEATKKILNDSDLKNTPILAISSYAMQNEKDRAFEVGIKEYITKPIDKNMFFNTIKKYLN